MITRKQYESELWRRDCMAADAVVSPPYNVALAVMLYRQLREWKAILEHRSVDMKIKRRIQ